MTSRAVSLGWVVLAAVALSRPAAARQPARQTGSPGAGATSTWQDVAQRIFQESGVEATFDLEFPERWASSQPKYDPVPDASRRNALLWLRVDLAHYEPAFLRANVSRIYLYSKLSFRDQAEWMTWDNQAHALYYNYRWIGDDGKRWEAATGFHNGLAQMLLEVYRSRFPAQFWRSQNPPKFAYQNSTPRASIPQDSHSDGVGADHLWRDGFVCGDSKWTLEADAATVAELLIAKPSLLRKRTEISERIRNKADLLVAFYRSIGYREPVRKPAGTR
jgi:hypothetical protein